MHGQNHIKPVTMFVVYSLDFLLVQFSETVSLFISCRDRIDFYPHAIFWFLSPLGLLEL